MQKSNLSPTAIITGSARRIGKEIALYLHQHGYNITLHYNQSQKDAENLVANLNNIRKDSALSIQADLLETSAIENIIKKTINKFNRLDLLINNASVFIKTENDQKNLLNETTIWNQIFSINVKAPFHLSQYALPYLQQTNGSIINITDIHASTPLKDYSVYCQSKAALEMQTKSFALAFAPLVRVNAIAPGAIIWPEEKNELNNEIKQKIIDKTLLKKHGNPVYIAKAVYALAQNEYITGQILRVDGGRYL